MAKARISDSPAVPRASSPRNEIAVIGLARSGRAVAALLARSGNNVYASDVERTSQLDETASALEREGADVLRALHLRAVAAGNIGMPLSEIALDPVVPQWIALEVSSYQLHFTPSIQPTVGVLTNLSPNHLDRYESVDQYYGDKKLLFRNASPASQWVSNADDVSTQRLSAGVAGIH